MDAIANLSNIDYVSTLVSIFIIISAIVAICTLVGKFWKILSKPISWFERGKEDHELIIQNVHNVQELTVKYDEVSRDIKHLTDMVLKKEINDIRGQILEFSSNLSSGKIYNMEAFRFIFQLYEDYEQLLEENNLTNGLVTESMIYIREKYRELLEKGLL